MKKIILLTLLLALSLFKASQAQNCQAGFGYSLMPGTTIVGFYDSSYTNSGTITNYIWSFGDSTTGSGMNPVHTYSSTGYYFVTLTITTSTGCTSTTFDTVLVGLPCNLFATITYSNFVQTLTVAATNGTAPYTYLWSNGGTGSSIQALAPGTYCVTVTDANACSYQTCYQVVSNNNCYAEFTYSSTMGSPTVYFYDTSYAIGGSVSSYLWNFGDNTTSTLANPIHTYPNTGTYGVTLTISTTTGCTSTYYDTVYAGVQFCNLFAFATFNPTSSSLDVQAFGGAAPYTYMWNPGNGLSSPIVPNPTVSVSTPTTYCVIITDMMGCTYQTCATALPASTDTICGNVFNDVNGNGIQDSTESSGYGYLTVYGSNGQYSATVDSITGHYSLAVPAGVYTIWFCNWGMLTSFTVPTSDSGSCAYYDSVVVSGGGVHCGYNFGLQYNASFIEGDIFFDINNNGVFDSNESGIPYQSVHAGNYWGYTNQNGHYSITVLPGTYTVAYTPSGNYAGYTVTTPTSYSVTLANGATSANNSFGLYTVPGSTNLAVSLVPHTTVTSGFPAWYDIYVNNIGANPTSATLTMYYDAALNFTNANPAQASHNAGARTITWNVPTINPGSSRSFHVNFVAALGLTLGASTFEFVGVTANSGIDINLSNNSDTLHQVVTGSWDPNNKLVVSSNYSDPNYQVISSVNPNQTIDYTINFQNTGTGPAVNITVLDELSADLDANSFQLLGTSHNATVSKNGNQLSFLFANIMLADSNSNEPASHGYINFRVNANAGLLPGHSILDKADIYFDFNSPVATNDATLLLINPLSILESNTANTAFVSPNPVSDEFVLNFAMEKASDVRYTLKNIQGQIIETVLLKNQVAGTTALKLSSAHLAEGLYLLELNDGNKTQTIKLVKTK